MQYKAITLFIINFICLSIQATSPQPGERLWNILAETELSAKTTNSKLDDISLDLTGIYTALQEITDQLIVDISKLDELAITSFNPFSYTDAMLSNLDTTQSLIEPIESVADVIDDCLGTAISQDDVGTTGFSITAPGRYYLSENITFSPASGIPAIEINSDDVFFDLSGFTITQGNMQMTVNGIEVIGGNDNIVITNGTIRNTSEEGLLINPNVNNVILSNLQVLESGIIDQGGMTIDGVDGIDFMGTTNGILINVTSSTSSDEGIDFDDCQNFYVKDCVFTGNRGADGAMTFAGSLTTDGFFFENCIFANNVGSGAVIARTALNVVFKSCKFINNNDHGITTGNGLVVDNFVFVDCIFQDNANDGVLIGTGDFDHSVFARCNISNNGRDGVRIDSSDADQNFFFRNTLIENDGNSINNAAGATNSFLGNYAFKSSGTNYVAGGSTINSTPVSTTSAFSTQPVFWRNINATT